MVTIKARVPQTLYEEIRDLAAAEVDSISHVIRRALTEHVRRDGRDPESLARERGEHEQGF